MGTGPDNLLRSRVKPTRVCCAILEGIVPVSWLLSKYSKRAPRLPRLDGMVPLREFLDNRRLVKVKFPMDGGMASIILQITKRELYTHYFYDDAAKRCFTMEGKLTCSTIGRDFPNRAPFPTCQAEALQGHLS